MGVRTTLSGYPFAYFRYALKEDAEDGREEEGGYCGEDNLHGSGPHAEGTVVTCAEPFADGAGDIDEDEHVAEIHAVAGLGNGGDD